MDCPIDRNQKGKNNINQIAKKNYLLDSSLDMIYNISYFHLIHITNLTLWKKLLLIIFGWANNSHEKNITYSDCNNLTLDKEIKCLFVLICGFEFRVHKLDDVRQHFFLPINTFI